MTGKFVCYIIAICAIAVFPHAAVAGCGDHSGKQGWFEKFKGKWGGEDGEYRERGEHRKCKKKKKCHLKKGMSQAFWWRSSHMAEALRLDEAQIDRLDEIAKFHREKVMAAYDRVSEAKMSYRKVKRSGSSTPDEIRAVWQAKQDAKMEKNAAKLEMFLEMREVLTPDQREELALMKAHKGKKKGKRDCGHGRKHKHGEGKHH